MEAMAEALITERVRGFDLRLATQAGVFSHKEIDDGSRLLMEVMRVSPTARVLDIGCGYGVIGIVAAKLATKGSAVLVDVDIRATRLAQRNLELNKVANAEVVLGDGIKDLAPKSRFDVVVSNPPTHNGREVLDELVAGAYKVLKPRGQLYVVINRLLSLKNEMNEVFGNVEIADRSKGFVVARAIKVPRRPGQEEFEA